MGVGSQQNHGVDASQRPRCFSKGRVSVVQQRRRRRGRRCRWCGVGGIVTTGWVKANDSVRACKLPSPPILKRLCAERSACTRTSSRSGINGTAGRGAVNVRHRHRRHRKPRPPPQPPPSPLRTLPPPLPLPPSRSDLRIAATTTVATAEGAPPSPQPPPIMSPSVHRNDDVVSYATF